MKIYTRTGDKGETSLFGGQRVSKDALRVEAYGGVDELNALLGLVATETKEPTVRETLVSIQDRLFVLGAELATPSSSTPSTIPRIGDADIEVLERHIDSADAVLPPLTTFVLPGGTPEAARLHISRTVCRRAERDCVRLARVEEVNPTVLIYLNRLSDLLFVLARWVNQRAGVLEVPWPSREPRDM